MLKAFVDLNRTNYNTYMNEKTIMKSADCRVFKNTYIFRAISNLFPTLCIVYTDDWDQIMIVSQLYLISTCLEMKYL